MGINELLTFVQFDPKTFLFFGVFWFLSPFLRSFLYFRVNITNFFKSMSPPLLFRLLVLYLLIRLLAFFNDVIWVKLVLLQSVFFAFLFFVFFFFFFCNKEKKKKKKKKKK